MMLFMVVVMLSCEILGFYYGMHRCECITGYMYHCSMLGYILVCLFAGTILAGLISSIVHSCLVICVYAYVWIVMHCLWWLSCMRLWCVLLLTSCMDDWTLARMTVAWSYSYVLCFYMLS